MDLLERLLNNDRGRRGGGSNDFFDTLRGLSRWIIGCGCALIVAVAAFVALIVTGAISLGDQGLMIIVVVITIFVAVISLLRTGQG